jgi:Outer membrane protein beta-barrel domain
MPSIMKKYILLLLLSMSVFTSRSQVLLSLIFGDKLNSDKLEFGLDGGLNLANLQGLDGANTASRFNIGFYFDFKLKNPSWMIHTGVIVKSTMGATDLPVYDLNDSALNNAFVGGSVDRRLSYFNVPVLMKYNFKNRIFAESGIMLGLMNKSIDEFTKKINDKDDLTYKLKIRDQYHPIDAGLMVGLGYRLLKGNGMNLGLRYYFGIIDVSVDDSGKNMYNRSFYATVGIPIGKGKAQAKEKSEAKEKKTRK